MSLPLPAQCNVRAGASLLDQGPAQLCHCPMVACRRSGPATQVDQETLKIDLIWSWRACVPCFQDTLELPVRRLLASVAMGAGCTLLPAPEGASRPQNIRAADFCRPRTSARERAPLVGPAVASILYQSIGEGPAGVRSVHSVST